MTAKDYLKEAVVCAVIAKAYENLKLVANAEYFRQRSAWYVAKALESLVFKA